MNECAECDFIGPDVTPIEQWQRETHRAWHAFVGAVVRSGVDPLMRAVSRRAHHPDYDEECRP